MMYQEILKIPKAIKILYILQYIMVSLMTKFAFGLNIVLLLVGVLIFFYEIRLRITEHLLQYSISHIFKKTYALNEISNIQINKVSALTDFGGWGIRYNRKYGWGFISNAEYLIRLELKNKKVISFSISDREALVNTLNSIPISKSLIQENS